MAFFTRRRKRRNSSSNFRRLRFEALEPRMLLSVSKIGSEFLLSDEFDYISPTPSIDGNSTGSVVTGWNERRGGGAESKIMVNHNGTGFEAANYHPAIPEDVKVAINEDGNFIVLWFLDGDTQIARFGGDNTKEIEGTLLEDVYVSSVDMAEDDTFVVVYGGADSNTYAQRFDAHFHEANVFPEVIDEEPILVHDAISYAATNMSVAMNRNGQFVVA